MKKDNNEQKNALIKLIIWMVIILGILFITNKNDNNNEFKNNNKDKVSISANISFEEKLSKLNNNYSYIYDIKTNGEEYKFVGEKYIPENTTFVKEHGYRTHKKENDTLDQLEYFLENGYIYKIENGGLDKIDNIYDIVDEKNIKIEYIKESILNKEHVNEDNKYIYNFEDKTITFIVNDENIISIEIISGNDYYNLKFDSIGNIKEVKY